MNDRIGLTPYFKLALFIFKLKGRDQTPKNPRALAPGFSKILMFSGFNV